MNRILAALLALVATQAFSQTYPNKPVRVIVPFATGSASDLIGRTVADRLTQALGQPFIVENRPGAGGTIGTEVVAKAPP
ncbi:MAG: tripartite tricarboxylate transporter substrate-binding protein, partial [Betaproteobacteria bacterium]